MNDQQRAAMQMALEALEDVHIEYDFHGNPIDKSNAAIEPAINALREALAQDGIDSLNRESRLPKRFTKFDGDTML